MSEAAEPSRPRGGTGARAAWLVGAGIFLSRIAGLVRESVFSFYFGNSAIADAWGAAWRTPNLIQILLGEGTLSASLIPVYARFLEEMAGRRIDKPFETERLLRMLRERVSAQRRSAAQARR